MGYGDWFFNICIVYIAERLLPMGRYTNKMLPTGIRGI